MISILVAYTKNNRIIGAQGVIPWKTNFERRRFKQICNGKRVIMGRKTFEEIGHALPYCTIVIVSNTMKEAPEGCEVINNEQLTMNVEQLGINGKFKINDQWGEEILVAGGGEIYREFLPLADRIYATEILVDYDGDVIFPQLDDTWVETERVHITDDLIPYDYVTFERINNK